MSLKIQNIALIPQVEVEFSRALNVLTGETGAGKSIILGSFNFILGEKLSKDVIRAGANHARVDAVFSVSGIIAEQVLDISGIEVDVSVDNTVILSRTLKIDGKSECRINGNVVTIGVLKDVASKLINIHGQHEHEVLLKPKNHVNILDSFGGNKIYQIRNKYNEQYQKLLDLKKGLKTFGGTDAERDRLIDMYRYQINEIENASLREGEDDELHEFKQKMVNFEKINLGLSSVLELFKDMPYSSIVSSLNSVSKLDSKIERILENARSLQYELNDVESNIERYIGSLEYDEEKFKNADARLDEIKVLKRKYGGTIPQIFTFLNETRGSLDFLTKSVEDIENIKKNIKTQELIVENVGIELTEIRKEVSGRLIEGLIGQLKDLGMPACKIEIDFNKTNGATGNGFDEIEFMFSANAGEKVKPLASIISGGEMSRFMLSLKTVVARLGDVETLVFDEIDTGIGGTMGMRVAEKLQTLSRNTQVICVTHLAQIAGMADSHFLIKKDVTDGKTITNITSLNKNGQIEELARMIGSGSGDTAREHAVSIKKVCDDFKGV